MTVKEYDREDKFYHFRDMICDKTGIILRQAICHSRIISSTYFLVEKDKQFAIGEEQVETIKKLIT